MTTNISKVFNIVLKGARSLPVTALVQLTFYYLNSYFVARRELGANRLTSAEQFTPYVDAQIQGRVIKVGSMEIMLYDHVKGLFHVKSRSGRTHCLNLHENICTCGKTLIHGFPCSHIIVACQHRYVDFHFFMEGYYTTQSYYDTWASLFHPIFNEDEWPLMMALRLYYLSQCNALEVDVLNQLGCIMKWTLGRGKPRSHVGCANN